MGSLLDQIKGGMSKPKRASKAGGSKSKRKISKRSLTKFASGKTTKTAPRVQRRAVTSARLRKS